MRKLLLLIVLLVASSCATNSHTINSCGGIDIPICEVEVEGQRSLDEEIEFQEKEFKSKMLRTMTIVIDQALQNLLQSMK